MATGKKAASDAEKMLQSSKTPSKARTVAESNLSQTPSKKPSKKKAK